MARLGPEEGQGAVGGLRPVPGQSPSRSSGRLEGSGCAAIAPAPLGVRPNRHVQPPSVSAPPALVIAAALVAPVSEDAPGQDGQDGGDDGDGKQNVECEGK